MDTNTTTSGPFETEQDARRAVADWESGISEANRSHLLAAIGDAGITIGAYDARIIDWLTEWEPGTVAVIAGLISRANRET